jgi:hypothetical protein
MAKTNSALARAFEAQLLKDGEGVVKRWKDALDSDKAPAVEGAMDRYVLAQMLENAASVLGTEAVTTNTSSGVVGSTYQAPVLGMIRQVYPRLMAPYISSIQPISMPTAIGYKLDLQRDDQSDLYDHNTWAASETYADHGTGEGATIGKGTRMSLSTFSVAVGTPKKLRTEATLELTQDLRATHNLDAQELLRQAAVDEIAFEIDAMLVRKAYEAATAHRTVTFGAAPGTGGWTSQTWAQRLQRAILQADNAIYNSRGRNATFLICGSNAALELADLNTFKMDAGFVDNEVASYGIERVGTLNSRYTVLRSRIVPADEILVGRKGDNILDAGLFYLPYVALFISDPEFDVITQKFHRSFQSRFATHVASNEYFAKVVLDENATGISES